MKLLMKKSTLISLLFVAVSAISFSYVGSQVTHQLDGSIAAAPNDLAVSDSNLQNQMDEVSYLSSIIFSELKLEEKGLSRNALELAVKGYLHLREEGRLENPLLSIVDLSQSSRNKRFYLLDMRNNKLLENTYVAHGKSSGADMASDFSNAIGSEKSSLGFYLTGETYKGKHGFSLKIEGLEEGFNDNAADRAIVVHGANYECGSSCVKLYGTQPGLPGLANG